MHLHIVHRLPIVAAALLLIVPLVGVQMGASLITRHHAAQEFQSATETALQQKQHSLDVLNDLRKETGHKKLLGRRLHEIERERRKLQREIANLHTEADLKGSAPEQQHDAVEIAKQLKDARFSQELSPVKATRMLQRLVHKSGLDDNGKLPLALHSVFAAEKVIALRQQDEKLLKQEKVVGRHYVRNEQRVRASTYQLTEARKMVRQVQSVVFELQTELERIDAQIARFQERRDIANGTLDPQHNKYEEAKGYEVEFQWPAKARISAGYLSASYKKFFGIPHYGLDIAVPQGTPVKAVADGIVYLARDAGMGYSYVLIAHRDGYTSLYGHMSQIAVRTGQEVSAGVVIGLSGGGKGTPGAGNVTTGSHLHLEITKDGKHIDPLTKLP